MGTAKSARAADGGATCGARSLGRVADVEPWMVRPLVPVRMRVRPQLKPSTLDGWSVVLVNRRVRCDTDRGYPEARSCRDSRA